MAPKPRRVVVRPDPTTWSDTELMSLAEAAALLFPEGLLTTSSLRSAYRAGQLEVIFVARKCLVNKVLVAKMIENARRKGPPKGSPEGGSGSGTAKQRPNIRQ
jgi:hypothetical protein